MADLTRDDMRDRLGNIEQIRDLLMGGQFDIYDRQFAQLDANIHNLRKEMDERINKLQASLNTEIRASFDSLEKKIKYLSLTTHEKTNQLSDKIDKNEIEFSEEVENLSKSINNKSNYLKEDLEKLRKDLQEDIETFKNQTLEELMKRFSLLKEDKVSRDDLAEILFDLCIKVKGSDFVPDIREAVDNQMQADFLLPEQENEQRNHGYYE